MMDSDWKFWNQSVSWWQDKAQEYLTLGDTVGFERCMNRTELNLLRRQEETGTVIVWGPEIYV